MYKNKTIKKHYNKTFSETKDYVYHDTINSGFGKISIFYNPRQQNYVMMKQQRYKTKEEYKQFLEKALNRQKIFHPKVNAFIGFSSEYNKAGKLVDYIIRRFYSYHQNSLKTLIEQKQKNNISFKQEELIYLVYDILEAGAFLQSNGLFHGLICPDIILRSKDYIYLLGDNLKYKSSSPQNMIDKYLSNEDLYMAPEIFRAACTKDSNYLRKANIYKSDVFNLGLCILAAGLLIKPTNIYNKQTKGFNFGQLQKYIEIFQQKYKQNPLLIAILKNMLKTEPHDRPCFQSIFSSLPSRQALMQYYSHIRNSQVLQKNLTSHGSLTNNNIIQRRQRSLSKTKLHYRNQNEIQIQGQFNNNIRVSSGLSHQQNLNRQNHFKNAPQYTQVRVNNYNQINNNIQNIGHNHHHNIFNNPQNRSRTYMSKSPDYGRNNTIKKSYTIFENQIQQKYIKNYFFHYNSQ